MITTASKRVQTPTGTAYVIVGEIFLSQIRGTSSPARAT
jgi:hypothetical protein